MNKPKPDASLSGNLETDSSPLLSGEQAILAAAEYLFSEQGYEAVSMSAIAARANTSKPNIYHHFKNKHQLYLAVIHKAAEHSAALLDRLADDSGTFESKLTAFATGQLGSILAHERRSRLILREALSGASEKGRDIAKHVVGEGFARLVDMIHQGQIKQEFRSDIDPALAAFMVVSSNVFFFQSSAVMKHLPDIQFTNNADEFGAGMMDILLNGVAKNKEKGQ